jgi:recombinational DNA repair protein (RecF pathway)
VRPRYSISAITLARTPHGEANAHIALLTSEFGLVRARAQGVRKPGAKLAPALQTLAECEAILVRGKEGWRLSGAVLSRNRFTELSSSARLRAGRVAQLLLRLVPGETRDHDLYALYAAFLDMLPSLNDLDADAAETLAVLRTLRILGLDAGEMPGEDFSALAIENVKRDRRAYILRVNRGLGASGL